MDQAFLVGRVAAMVALPVGGIMYMGMGASAQHYDVPPAQAMSRIASAYLPTHVLGSNIKGSRVSLSGQDTVITSLIAEDGTELMRFVTKVEADGKGSSVSTTIEPPTGANAERAAKVMQSQALAMSLLDLLAKEHVAAAIEQRPFNMLAMSPGGSAMAKNIPGMQEHLDQANASAAAMAEFEQDAFNSGDSGDGWADEPVGGGDDWGG